MVCELYLNKAVLKKTQDYKILTPLYKTLKELLALQSNSI